MIARDARGKRRTVKTPIARGIKLPTDVTVRTFHRDGFRDTEVDIGPDHLAQLALAGRVPAEHLDTLRDHSKFLIISLHITDEEMGVQRTRSQLRHELVDLLRALRSGNGLPAVPPWLRGEIETYFIRYRLDLPFGKAPDISMQEVDDWCRRQNDARAEVQAAFADPAKLAGVVDDVLGFLKRSKPFTREYYATKSAFRPELEIIFHWIGGFWRSELERDVIRSNELRDFAIETLRMCGVEISGLSLEQRLQAMFRSAASAD